MPNNLDIHSKDFFLKKRQHFFHNIDLCILYFIQSLFRMDNVMSISTSNFVTTNSVLSTN